MDPQSDALAVTRSSPTPRAAEDHRGQYDGRRPPSEIEEDIARTRVRLSAAIEALERELVPNRVLEKGAELLRDSLEPRPGPFSEQIWAYAIPLALISVGLGALFVLRRRSYCAEIPSSFGELPAEAVDVGETGSAAFSRADMVEPVEAVSLVDDGDLIRAGAQTGVGIGP